MEIPSDRIYSKYSEKPINYILLGSLSKCKEGLDIAHLNTALFAMPP